MPREGPAGGDELRWRLRSTVSQISLFPIMRNGQVRATDLVSGALERVSDLLPPGWRLQRRHDARLGDRELDAVIELTGPSRTKVAFAVEAKAGSVPRSLLIPALRDLERTSGLPVVFVSEYVGPALRHALTSAGLGYADATGWVRMVSADPLVILNGVGATRAPRQDRNSSAVTRLNGLAAGRTVRELTLTTPPIGVRSLAHAAQVSPSSVSKLLVTLEAEGVVDREPTGEVRSVRRRALIRRWALDYSFAKTNRSPGWYIAPRGLGRTMARLSGRDNVALTGSAAARRLLPESSTPVVPLRLLALYAADPPELARELGLVQAEPSVANVTLARPQDPSILVGTHGEALTLAPLPLVLVDLLTLPGRSDAEAEQLMDALAIKDDGWKE